MKADLRWRKIENGFIKFRQCLSVELREVST
nr:MAG TPA: hypothetical protein [Caudoviricetes sp.]